MSAYVIAHLTVDDEVAYEGYVAGFFPILVRHGGRMLLADDNPEVLEGSAPQGRHVILEFPGSVEARAWYADPDYRRIQAIRIASSHAHLIGLGETPDALAQWIDEQEAVAG